MMKKTLLLISSFCLLLFLVSCNTLSDDTTSTSEIESAAETTNEAVVAPDSTVSETEEAPTEEEITEEPSYEESTREPTEETSAVPTDEDTTPSAETSSEEITEESSYEESTHEPTEETSAVSTDEDTTPSAETSSEETTEEPTEPVTYEDEFVNAVISELPDYMQDLEKSLHEHTAIDGIEHYFRISTSPRILSPGDTLEITVDELYYYLELQDMEYYCTTFLAYSKPQEEWDVYSYLNLFLYVQKFGTGKNLDLYPSTEDYVHWYLTIPEDMEPGSYLLFVRIYDEIPFLCCFIVH